jgi:hypothetical protein
LPVLESAVMGQGMGGFKQFLKVRPIGVLDWKTTDISPFYNINNSESLARAEGLFEQKIA